MHAAKNQLFLSGNEAIARGAWEAGVAVACAYPGTPSTEILEAMSQYSEVDSQWSVNEKVAFEVALGASYGGVRALYASKHVGLNVAMDPLMSASYTGIHGGFVAVVADDPGMHSSQNEQDTRWIGPFGKVPVLDPSDPGDAYTFIQEAFKISEQFDTPVIFRTTSRVSHSKENLPVGTRGETPRKPFAVDIPKYVLVPGNARRRHLVVEQRTEQLKAFAETTPLNRVELGDRSIGFITSGTTYQYIRECYPQASILKLGLAWPLCEEKIRAFAQDVQEVMVIEELDAYYETQIKAMGIKVKGKHPSFLCGELRPEYIPDIVAGKPKDERKVAATPPSFCKGCPHRFVFKVLHDLDLVVAGDIGCYALGAMQPFASLHTCVCMGSGVTFLEGFRRAHFPDEKKVVGVVGDSTFFHSGITGLINAVYNGSKGVQLILDNSITAMTGGQDNPATGKTITGAPAPKVSIEEICRACGADNVDVIKTSDTKGLTELIQRRLEEDALSVIITRSPCILTKMS